MIKRALISVSDKRGVVEFARGLRKSGVEIISTGGTAAVIAGGGVQVTKVEDITKFPECFSGRVKTIHPVIIGGLLFVRGNAEHEKQVKELGIGAIDLVVVDLYPFDSGGSENKNAGVAEKVELIDIGGQTLLRSAAKNFKFVTAICDKNDYGVVLEQIMSNGDTTLELRKQLASKAFLRTAAYDGAITEWLSDGMNRGVLLTGKKKLRYGENPQQNGSFYKLYRSDPGWKIMQENKQMSYLNVLDADGAWNLVREFDEPAAACIKHANPSGVASHRDIVEAFQRAYDADRLSAFGVIIALNRRCPKEIIEKIIEQKIFAEIILATGYEEGALELLSKRPKLRVLKMGDGHVFGDGGSGDCDAAAHSASYRSMLGGMLVQEDDNRVVTEKDLKCVTGIEPTRKQISDMLFAWKVVKHAKSNAIVLAKDCISVGIGCGQTSRVDAAIIAVRRAGAKSRGAVMASDAFFPFPDSVEEAAKHGISAVIQPGGSIRDADVFKRADELGISMVVTGVRAFRH